MSSNSGSNGTDRQYRRVPCPRCGAGLMRNFPDSERQCVICGYSDYDSLVDEAAARQTRRLLAGIDWTPRNTSLPANADTPPPGK